MDDRLRFEVFMDDDSKYGEFVLVEAEHDGFADDKHKATEEDE